MSSAATACTSRPLSGVRVLLHIRRGPSDEDGERRSPSGGRTDYAKKRKEDGSRASAGDILRAARAHVQQLGATLALSEAAADLVVFHRGSMSFLEDAHVKFKAVVRPDYLAACVAANQRVNTAPYIVTPAMMAAAVASTAPNLKSAAPSSHTLAASLTGAPSEAANTASIPCNTRSGTKKSSLVRGNVATAPSPSFSSSLSRAPRSQLKFEAETSTPGEEVTSPHQLHRLVSLDEDEEGGKLDSQRQQCILAALARAATAREEDAVAVSVASSSTPSSLHAKPITITNRDVTKPYHLLDDMPDGNTRSLHCAAGTLQSDAAVSLKRDGNFPTYPSSSVMLQQRRSTTRVKRGAHQASTAAVELDEDITQQPSAGTASTPRLTPSPRHDVSSDGSQGPAAALRKLEVDAEEEEAIRHAVLRSTATAAVTRRRGRPPKQDDSVPTRRNAVSLRGDRTPGDRNATLKRDRDPFLNSEARTQRQPLPQLASALPSSEICDVGVAFTQPLAASSLQTPTAAVLRQTPSTVPAVPTRRTAKRPPRSSTAEGCMKGPTHLARTAPPDKVQRSRRRRRTQGEEDGAVAEEMRKSLKQQQRQHQHSAQRRRRLSSQGRTEVPRDLECTPAAEPPFSMTFTDLALLRPLASEDEQTSMTVSRLCVHVFLDDVAEVDASGGAAAAASLSFFLRDVVEQLGAACVVLSGDDSGEYPCWFGRHKRVREGWRSRTAKKPTHLVASPRAALTPDILYCKALGIPMVTPQWLYDAIALGTFPAILPHIHTHPVYGDRHVASAAVAAAGVPRRDGLLGGEEEDGDVGVGEAPRADVNPTLSSMSSDTGDSAAVPQAGMRAAAARPRCPSRCGDSFTLRQLHKEVAEEYVPAGEQAMRPFYAPIFQDRMFYLYVPPAHLVNTNATGGGAWPLRSSRGSRNDPSRSYLGDAVAALAQVTELLRVLGGTVTRNVESTHLDLVIDLTGFYDDMATVGLTAGESQWQQHRARTLRESLSCAFHDALRRVSQQSASLIVSAAATTTDASPTAPPVVGISWLIYSILTRQWTAVDSFVLAGHPLTPQSTAAHADAQLSGTADAGATAIREGAKVSGAAPEPVGEEAAESPRTFLWSAVLAAAAAPHLKCAQGPKVALKQASHQLNTQEIEAILGDAQPKPFGVPGQVAPYASSPARSPHQSIPTSF